ncbi:MAG: hydroxymethylbilane synthase, partial [Betaproteobacteria bacterium]|nr:hydroxymethylbilane synthase [Betaproteobacteria bacterium]
MSEASTPSSEARATGLVIASRESRLAMWQAEHVRERLSALDPGLDVRILSMTTRGDQILDRAL